MDSIEILHVLPFFTKLCMYTVLHIFRQVLFGAGNQGNHQKGLRHKMTQEKVRDVLIKS